MNEHNLFYGKNNNPFLIQISKTCSGFYKSPNYLKSEKQFKKLARIKEKIFPRKKLLTSLENELNLFHHSILARKIATNPQYIQMKNRTCHTDRGYTIKPRISQNFFLTKINNSQNSSDIIENNSNKKPHKAIFYKGLTKNNDNNINLLIPAQCFIKFDLKKYQRTNYPDIIRENTSDFMREIKSIRKMNLINKLRKEAEKVKEYSIKKNIENYELNMHSLKESKKLLKFFSKNFIEYHRFLLETIKKENDKLKKIISEENTLFNEVKNLYRKTDSVKMELQVIKNYKNLLEEILKKKKPPEKNISPQNKKKLTKSVDKKKVFKRYPTFKEKIYKEMLKTSRKNLLLNSDNSNEQGTNYISNKPNLKRKNFIRKQEHHYTYAKYQKKNIFSIDPPFSRNKKSKTEKVKFNFPEKTKISNKDLKSEKSSNKNLNENYLLENEGIFQNELNSYEHRLIKGLNKYSILNSEITELEVKAEKDNNYQKILEKNNKMIQQFTSDLNYLKNNNEYLNNRLKELTNQKDDNTFMIVIFQKFKNIINNITQMGYPKEYEEVFINVIKLSKTNLSKESKKITTNTKKEIIKYIFNSMIEIEKIADLLIFSRKELDKNEEIHKKLREIESKMTEIKKIENNKKKRQQEILKREILAEKTIKKMYKTFYKPIKPVPEKFNFKKHHKK